MTMTITSSAFSSDQAIPREYTGEGRDISPALAWNGVPPKTQELALICDDPDAPTPQPWVHWLIYQIPPSVTGLPQDLARTPKVRIHGQVEAIQGINSWCRIGYGGPRPPSGHGVHHYYFKLYAIDTHIGLCPGANKQALLQAMSGHILAHAELIGTYQR